MEEGNNDFTKEEGKHDVTIMFTQAKVLCTIGKPSVSVRIVDASILYTKSKDVYRTNQ